VIFSSAPIAVGGEKTRAITYDSAGSPEENIKNCLRIPARPLLICRLFEIDVYNDDIRYALCKLGRLSAFRSIHDSWRFNILLLLP
jgi:hypothetical protein